MPTPWRAPESRFFSFVRHEGGCWLWTGYRAHAGHGQFWFEGRSWPAHRWAYVHWIGPLADDVDLDHFVCDTPACANPRHVRPAACRENLLRSDLTFAARNLVKTHCPEGHAYDEGNTIRDRNGGRTCRTCQRRRWREYARRRRAASQVA